MRALAACLLLACSDPSAVTDAGADGCDSGSTPSATFPGPHPALPFAKSAGGPTIASPRIVPFVFAAEDRTADIAAFTKALGASSYWAIAAQYGVGPATASDPIVVGETPPADMNDSDVIAWLQGKLAGGADPSAIYVVYYPEATTIHTAFGDSCIGFGGYHSEATVGTTKIVYAVIARCATGVHAMTTKTAHELFEAATDPYVLTSPAYNAYDDAGKLVTYESEIGDMCEGNPEIFSSELGYPIQRIWSNAASLAAQDPCQPGGMAPYFQTLADVTGPGRSIALAAGDTTTVSLVAFSDRDTGGPWTVTVSGSSGTPSDDLELSLCRTSARNGETIPLTITRPATSTETNWVTIQSTLGDAGTWSSLFVGY